MSKVHEKEKAITLRKQGKTYTEILKTVPVAKSTLSLWLREVGLATAQKQTLTAKKKAAQQRGGDRRKEMRLIETEQINQLCQQDIKNINNRELFLIGVALYWAEGAKRSGNKPGVLVDFGNSDPAMIKLFITWLFSCAKVRKEDIVLRLHLHENHRDREDVIKNIWSKQLHLPTNLFGKTIYKKHKPKTVRYKVGEDYIGLVSVRVKGSTRLNRRILGWIYAIIAATK